MRAASVSVWRESREGVASGRQHLAREMRKRLIPKAAALSSDDDRHAAGC